MPCAMTRGLRLSPAVTVALVAMLLVIAPARAQTGEGAKHDPHPGRDEPIVDGRLEETPDGVDYIGRAKVGRPGTKRNTNPGALTARPAATPVADRSGERAEPTPATPVPAKESPPAPTSI